MKEIYHILSGVTKELLRRIRFWLWMQFIYKTGKAKFEYDKFLRVDKEIK